MTPVNTPPAPAPDGEVEKWFGNCDGWGAAEWFDRLANAVMEQDKAAVAGDELRMATYRNIAASSAMELVRGYRTQVRAALATAKPETPAPAGVRGVRKEVMRLMREDFDPTPPGWEGREWDDNAEDVADKIIVAVLGASSMHAAYAWLVLKKWLAEYAEEESSFSRYKDNVLLDGVMTAGDRRALSAVLTPPATGDDASYHQAWVDDWSKKIAASPAPGAPLTEEELQAVYAGPHYEEAINLVFGSQDGMTIGEIRDKLRAMISASPAPAKAAGVDDLLRAVRRAEDGAGTLPTKEAVNLRPADWHAVCDAARKLASPKAGETW